MSAATLITVAPTGAESPPQAHPALPVTLDAVVATARACQAAGAAMIHLHVRDAAGLPTLDPGLLRDTVVAVREATDLIVQLSTGGAVTDPLAARLAVLDAGPDACSLTTGTVNFGDDVFSNPWPFVAELYQRTQAMGILPEFELFELGHVTALHRLLDTFGAPAGGHVHADFVLGVPGGMPGTTQALASGIALLPAGATWSATGIGRTSVPVMLGALSLGGHLRVGMEDTLTYAPKRPVRDNAELVERAARLAAEALRPAASPARARALLGLPTGG
ncbi:MAG: 3-keto-5-aminohexanoate cleavage protein [Candidatus Nanopelagicales bacterium]|nr:3-keto-5-aminohexanoate cleavage protein [Candidatus Nanopelagicales bacterium]